MEYIIKMTSALYEQDLLADTYAWLSITILAPPESLLNYCVKLHSAYVTVVSTISSPIYTLQLLHQAPYKGTVQTVSAFPPGQDRVLYPPVTSSLTSASTDFLNSLNKAGIPPTFFIAILFSSVDLPKTRFRRAPQAFFWTSKTLWSKRSTRCLIPPNLHT